MYVISRTRIYEPDQVVTKVLKHSFQSNEINFISPIKVFTSLDVEIKLKNGKHFPLTYITLKIPSLKFSLPLNRYS